MSYRQPRLGARSQLLLSDSLRQAGHRMLWRRYTGDSGGDPARGVAPEPQFVESEILGYIQFVPRDDEQSPVGMIYDERAIVTTREKLGQRDELVWQGRRYRIESSPAPSLMTGYWSVNARRGDAA